MMLQKNTLSRLRSVLLISSVMCAPMFSNPLSAMEEHTDDMRVHASKWETPVEFDTEEQRIHMTTLVDQYLEENQYLLEIRGHMRFGPDPLTGIVGILPAKALRCALVEDQKKFLKPLILSIVKEVYSDPLTVSALCLRMLSFKIARIAFHKSETTKEEKEIFTHENLYPLEEDKIGTSLILIANIEEPQEEMKTIIQKVSQSERLRLETQSFPLPTIRPMINLPEDVMAIIQEISRREQVMSNTTRQ